MPVQVNSIKWIIVLFILISVIIPIGFVSAQTDSTRAKADTAIIHRGTKALQFQLGNPFSSREEQSLIFSGRYYLNTKSAIRVGLEFNEGSMVNKSNSERYSPYDTSAYSSRQYDFTAMNSLLLQYIRYRMVSSKINIYYGAGPRLSYENRYRTDQYNHNYSNYDAWGFGIDGTIGVEWFATKRISFNGEYGFVIRYLYIKSVNTSDPGNGYYHNDGYKYYHFELRTLEAVFGISIYF